MAKDPEIAGEATAIVAGLTYPSESDEPFDVVVWPPSASAIQALRSRVATKRAIREVSIDDFFIPLKASESAERFVALRHFLETRLSDIHIIRVGADEVEVDVYLLGRSNAAGWLVLHTKSVET